MASGYCVFRMDGCWSVFCIERIFNFGPTIWTNKTGRAGFIQKVLFKTFFQDCTSISGYRSTLLLFPLFQGKRSTSTVMEIPDFHTEFRIKSKGLRHFFSLLVALCRGTFLPLPSTYFNSHSKGQRDQKCILAINRCISGRICNKNLQL